MIALKVGATWERGISFAHGFLRVSLNDGINGQIRRAVDFAARRRLDSRGRHIL
jgi:hypothetical protein